MTFPALLNYLSYLYNLSIYCSSHPVGWIGCNSFWGIVYLTAIVSLFIFCYKLVRFILKERRDWQNFIKRQEERAKIADKDTMEKHVWNGEF